MTHPAYIRGHPLHTCLPSWNVRPGVGMGAAIKSSYHLVLVVGRHAEEPRYIIGTARGALWRIYSNCFLASGRVYTGHSDCEAAALIQSLPRTSLLWTLKEQFLLGLTIKFPRIVFPCKGRIHSHNHECNREADFSRD